MFGISWFVLAHHPTNKIIMTFSDDFNRRVRLAGGGVSGGYAGADGVACAAGSLDQSSKEARVPPILLIRVWVGRAWDGFVGG